MCSNLDIAAAPPAGSHAPDRPQQIAIAPASTSRTWSLSDLVVDLIRSNPEIGLAGAKEREQFWGVEVAKAGWMPTIDMLASTGPQRVLEPTPEADMIRKEASLTVRKTLYDFGATAGDVARAEKAYDSAISARIAKSEEIAAGMMEALLKVRRAEDMIAVTRDGIAAHQKILDLVTLSQQGGNATVADTKRITTRLQSAKSSLIDLTTARSNAGDSFRSITGVDVARVRGIDYDALDGRPTALDAAAIERNPAIVGLHAELESLRHQLASVRAGRLPHLDLQGTVKTARNLNEPDSDDVSSAAYVLASLKVPLYDGGLNRGQQEQIASRINATLMRLEQKRRELRESALNAARAVSSDGDKVATLRTRAEAAKKVADLSLEQFRNGGKSVFELLDAQSEYFKARGELVEQTFTRRKAQLSALTLRGKLVQSLLDSATSR